MKSEYMTLLHALKEQIWLLRFLREIDYDISNQNIIYTDNQDVIALAYNPEHHAHTKHVDIQYHFIRNYIEYETIWLEYCSTKDMMIDDLTKVLEVERYKRLTKMMRMSVWQKFENYIIIKIDEKKKIEEEELNVAKVLSATIEKIIRIRNENDKWISSSISPTIIDIFIFV